MISKDALKFQSIQQTSEVLQDNQAVFEADDSTKAQINIFTGYVNNLKTKESKLNKPTQWLTKEKNQLLKILQSDSHKIVVALMRLANDTSNGELIVELNNTNNKHSKLTNKDTLFVANKLFDLMQEYSSELASYSISGEFITAYQQNTETVENKLAERKLIKEQNKQNSQEFNQLMKQCLEYLKDKLDWSIESYRESQPDMVTAYFSARKTTKTTTQHIDVRGFIVDKASGLPISYGNVTVIENGMQTGITEKGNFNFKNFPEGEFTLKVENINYETVMLTIRRYSNQYLNIKVEMKAIPVLHPVD
ncbi:carboxypeptidase-like regulatory domain-containing protein [Ancylomarina longa]|uniref:Carboxypeptidase-like regulatory domain-containing protein n=1 Tax=Ancylomarina longa TaxID=2487017 RepID=A0A434AFW6_9BACT|nr:carboxypeptidase-like regulatory domain-containing protein [Ancylomarina longa]RUT73273.1 hypothetical protein DLK05_13955 [Ancylomarina longa]